MDEFVRARRLIAASYKSLGFERPAFDTRNLSTDQCCAILEVLRAFRCPGPKLLLVPAKRFSMLGVGIWAHGPAV